MAKPASEQPCVPLRSWELILLANDKCALVQAIMLFDSCAKFTQGIQILWVALFRT